MLNLLSPLAEGGRQAARSIFAAAIRPRAIAYPRERRQELIGQPWSRKSAGQARSGGSEEGSIYLEGRRAPVTYPRISDGAGSRGLPAYTALRSYDVMDQEVQAKLVREVSTREFEDVACHIAEGTGLGKSTVSRAFIRASARSLAHKVNGHKLLSLLA